MASPFAERDGILPCGGGKPPPCGNVPLPCTEEADIYKKIKKGCRASLPEPMQSMDFTLRSNISPGEADFTAADTAFSYIHHSRRGTKTAGTQFMTLNFLTPIRFRAMGISSSDPAAPMLLAAPLKKAEKKTPSRVNSP